ncbi:MAG: TraB/GumN family protein, partial [bacterium]
MTLSYRLKTLSLTALGAVLGLGLAGAVAFQPVQAFAQAVEVAPAPVAAPRAVPQAEGAGPALWVVRDADSTL